MAVSEVRIIPVEYSAVMVIAPSTTITNWPKNRPTSAFDVGSNPAFC